jgi:hypothetical protein
MPERESAFYGGIWGSLGAYNHPHELTTNQKAAGSSPAERATESGRFAAKTYSATLFVRSFTRSMPQLVPQRGTEGTL